MHVAAKTVLAEIVIGFGKVVLVMFGRGMAYLAQTSVQVAYLDGRH